MKTADLLFVLEKWEIVRNRYSPEWFTEIFECHGDTALISSDERAGRILRISEGIFQWHDGGIDRLREFLVFMGHGGFQKGWEITWSGIPRGDHERILAGIAGFQSRYARELREFLERSTDS